MQNLEQYLLHKLKSEFKLATGCTDPAAIAAAVAQARENLTPDLHTRVQKIEIHLSSNIFKNGYAVDIPGCDEKGIPMVAALGYAIGHSNLGFEIFTRLTEDHIANAKHLVASDLVHIRQIRDGIGLTIIVILTADNGETVELLVQNEYLNVVSIKKNGISIFQKEQSTKDTLIEKGLTIQHMVEFIESVSVDELDFVSNGINTNETFVKEGIENPKGLKVGSLLKEFCTDNIMNDVGMKIKSLTASGVDSRMGGSTLPVMSSVGSGNLGIGATMPMFVVADHFNIPRTKLLRATALANLIHIYVKEITGKLTSACGGVLVAMGTSAAIVWMMDGTVEQIEGAIKNIAANLTGMICDGANYGCTFKVSTAATESYYAAMLAMKDCIASSDVGIVSESVVQTIQNVADIYVKMNPLDPIVLDMMLQK